jgi:hypothetical protein
VSTAMNSGVPLSLAGNSEIAAQFDGFTRRLIDPANEVPGAAPTKKGLLGLERIASLW